MSYTILLKNEAMIYHAYEVIRTSDPEFSFLEVVTDDLISFSEIKHIVKAVNEIKSLGFKGIISIKKEIYHNICNVELKHLCSMMI